MKKIILIAVTLMLVGGNISPSAAELISGNKVLTWCVDGEKDTGHITNGLCLGYVVAAIQGLFTILALRSPEKPDRICIPDRVTTGQRREIFVQYLKNNPKDRHKMAFVLFVGSMREAYPCPK
jgi:hypothetical protein